MTDTRGDPSDPRARDVPASAGSAEPFRLLIQQLPDMVSIYDAEGRFAYVNPAHFRLLGFRDEDLLGRIPLDFVHPDDAGSVAIEFAAQLAGHRPAVPVEFRFRHRDGTYRHVEAAAVDLTREPAVGGVLVSSRDVSARRRVETMVQDQAAILEGIARRAPLAVTLDALCAMAERGVPGGVAVVLVRRDERLRLAAAPSASARMRTALDRISSRPWLRARLRHGIVVASVASVVPRPEAAAVLAEAGLTGWWAAPVLASSGDGNLGVVTVLVPDERRPEPIDEQLLASLGSLAAIALEQDRAQARLAHQASHDALTGLPNRDQLIERLHALARGDGDGHAAVFFLDLDRFKVFNDSVGHGVGDRILVDVGRRLRGALREGDAVARFGGDEFVVVCDGLADVAEVHAVAERLLDVVSRPFVVDGMELVVSASVGVALVDGRPPEALLRDADAAMYHAKDRGRARVEVFGDDLRSRVVARLDTERDLRRALDADQFVVHYQPVVALDRGAVAGFEALARWMHPGRGLLAPEQFLEVAEETGLIARIGALTRRTALLQGAEWQRRGVARGPLTLAVNLSAAELRDASLPGQIEAALDEAGVDPGAVVLEVTERVLAADTDAAVAVLRGLRDLGVQLALDDFGTGSSPLLHLRRFPIHAVKLDAVLVAGLGTNRDDDVIAATVIELAHRLGLYVVAEGVEHASQAEFLREHGCLLAQGHAFAPAMAPDDAERWVSERLGDEATTR